MEDKGIIHEALGHTVKAWNKHNAVHIERLKNNTEVVSKLFSGRSTRSIAMKKHRDIYDQDAFWQRAKRHDIHMLARKVIEKFRENIKRNKPLYSNNKSTSTSQCTHGSKDKQPYRSTGNELIKGEIKDKLPSINKSSTSNTFQNGSHGILDSGRNQGNLSDRFSPSLEVQLKSYYRKQCDINEYLSKCMDFNKMDHEVIFNPPPTPNPAMDFKNCWDDDKYDFDLQQNNRRRIIVTLPNINADTDTHVKDDTSDGEDQFTYRPVSEDNKVLQEKSKSKKEKQVSGIDRKVLSSSTPRALEKKKQEPFSPDGAYKFDTGLSTMLARQRLHGLPPLQISFHSKVNDPVKYVINNHNILSNEADVEETSGGSNTTDDKTIVPVRSELKGPFTKISKAAIPVVRSQVEPDKLTVKGINPTATVSRSQEEYRDSSSSRASSSSKDSVGNKLNVMILNKKRAKKHKKKVVIEDDVSKIKEDKMVEHYRQVACSNLTAKEKAHRIKMIRSEIYAREKIKTSQRLKNKEKNDSQEYLSEDWKKSSRGELNQDLNKSPHKSEFVFKVYMRQKEMEDKGLPKVHRSVEQNKYLRHCGPLITDARINDRTKSTSFSDKPNVVLDHLSRKIIDLS